MTSLSERVAHRVMAAEPEPDPEPDDIIGELEIAEYVVFMLALDTYTRYIEEATGSESDDDLTRKGRQLIRTMDTRNLEGIQQFLRENVASTGQKRMLDKAFLFVPNRAGLARRTFNLRTVLSRGGTATMRAVFKNNRALREVKAAIAASMMDDADAALDKFAILPLKNTRLRKWIAIAAETAGSGNYQNAVAVGSEETVGVVERLLVTRVQQQGATGTSDANQDGIAEKDELLAEVQQRSQAQAQRAMEVSGESDVPPSKSEVVGIATAAAVAAISDPSNPMNVPVPLRGLDDEQRAAALTDGRVLVAAGAGAGKSTTVVARVEYLVKDRRVNPSRILVTAFNKKAANELKHKIGTVVGGDALGQMTAGSMHSLFKRFIKDYGTAKERAAMERGFIQAGGNVARAVQRIWGECFPEDSPQERKAPKLKNAIMAKSKWAGNNITPAQAKKAARTQAETDLADWYEMYEGLKGAIPGWEPPCSSKQFETFMGKTRPDGTMRLGDFDDMLGIFDDILKREPMVRKALQESFDHLIVDEAQDLNGVQFSVISQISKQVTDGSDGKSLWLVGDDKQSIYSFRGARPDMFTELSKTEGWKMAQIRTNYRCQPEIVDAANKLISHNENQIKMEANASPDKVRGVGSIQVKTPLDEAEAALGVVEEIKASLSAGGEVSDNAILTRTNKEQHAYETACIIRGIPYARKGASSFLGSPETTAFLSYVQIATGSDFGKMQKALGNVIDTPNRFFLGGKGSEQVAEAFSLYARRAGVDSKTLNPIEAMEDRRFLTILAEKLTRSTGGFKFNKGLESLDKLRDSLMAMRGNALDPAYKTSDLFSDILNVEGRTSVSRPGGRTEYIDQTFRESLQVSLRDSLGDDDSTDDDDDDDDESLGNIGFLFKLAQPDPTDPEDLISDPNTPAGFKAKMERYAEKARELRIDIDKWDKQQEALPPEKRMAPPGVYLGTAHSTKGAQWTNCYVAMPRGKFPMDIRPKPGDPPPDPAEQQAELEAERRLAYVALTRAKMNLTIVCPHVVGGKAAGISPFVVEAGLKPGENVPKPGAPTEVVEEVVEEEIKTAADFGGYEGILPDAWVNADVSYDRRRS